MMMDVSIITTVDRDKRLLINLLDSISNFFSKTNISFEVLIIDDLKILSVDDQVAITRDFPGVRLLHQHVHMGQLLAVLTGISQSDGKVVVTIDPDMEGNVPDVGRLLDAHRLSGADVIYARRVRRYGIPVYRKLGSLMLATILGWISGLKIKDINTPMVLLSRPAVQYLLSLSREMRSHKLYLLSRYRDSFLSIDIEVSEVTTSKISNYKLPSLLKMFLSQIYEAWSLRRNLVRRGQ